MRRGNPRRAAPATPPLPLWRAISARPPQLFRPPRQISAARSTGARRRLGVGETDPRRLGAVGESSPPRARVRAREQCRGEQGERERPIQPLSEHGVGEPRRERLALPSPAAKRRAPGARRQRAPRHSENSRRGERRRPGVGAAGLGRLDAPLPALRRGEPREPRRRRQTRTATAGSGRAASSRQARRSFPAGPGSPPGRLRWNASRKAASSSVRPARRTLAAAALRARRWRKTPAQGGFSRTMASRRESAAPARNAASASVSRRVDGPRPAGQRRRRGGRKALDSGESASREHGKRYAAAALLASPARANRRACRLIIDVR